MIFQQYLMVMKRQTLPMNEPDKSGITDEQLFFGSVRQLVSVPRAESQRRVKSAAKETTSRHKRYKIVPVENPPKP